MNTGIISPALPLSQLRHWERSCVGFPMSPPSCLLAKGLKEERENDKGRKRLSYHSLVLAFKVPLGLAGVQSCVYSLRCVVCSLEFPLMASTRWSPLTWWGFFSFPPYDASFELPCQVVDVSASFCSFWAGFLKMSLSRFLHIYSTHEKLMLPWYRKVDVASASAATFYPRPLSLTGCICILCRSESHTSPPDSREHIEN